MHVIDRLLGHVSGVVQVALLAALTAVQVALALQRWLYAIPLNVLPSHQYRYCILYFFSTKIITKYVYIT